MASQPELGLLPERRFGLSSRRSARSFCARQGITRISYPMNQNPLKQGMLTKNAVGIGTVTREMVRQRAVELALINGHSAQEPTKNDWDEARRELSGDSGLDPQDALLEAAPESERWDPVPGSAGIKIPGSLSEDEDEEGRSDSERLFEEGVAEAEHDQMLQAARSQKPEPE